MTIYSVNTINVNIHIIITNKQYKQTALIHIIILLFVGKPAMLTRGFIIAAAYRKIHML